MSEPPPDPDALRYARDWEPILAAPAHLVLERIDGTPSTFLDLGAGTGSLTLAAAARWPAARIVALDASDAMLSVARHRAHDLGHEPARFEWLAADAAAMPMAEGSMAAVGSSFVLQLVDERSAVLAEVIRVLAPGGTFAFVTWLGDELELPADEAFLDVLEELGLEDEPEAAPALSPTDYGSLEQVRGELAEAGFEGIAVRTDTLRFGWTAASYLAWKERFDERELFERLEGNVATEFRAALRRRLATLDPESFELRGTLVAGVCRRPRNA